MREMFFEDNIDDAKYCGHLYGLGTSYVMNGNANYHDDLAANNQNNNANNGSSGPTTAANGVGASQTSTTATSATPTATTS